MVPMAILAFGVTSLHAAPASHAPLRADFAQAVAAFDRAQIKGDGRWQVVFTQATRVPTP